MVWTQVDLLILQMLILAKSRPIKVQVLPMEWGPWMRLWFKEVPLPPPPQHLIKYSWQLVGAQSYSWVERVLPKNTANWQKKILKLIQFPTQLPIIYTITFFTYELWLSYQFRIAAEARRSHDMNKRHTIQWGHRRFLSILLPFA